MTQRTRDELDLELSQLRFRIRELEAELLELDSAEKRRAPRRLETVGVQFVAELEVVDAEGVDISDDGAQIALRRALRFNLRLEGDETGVARCAELVWARRRADGWTRAGFQFVEAHPATAF